VTLVDTNVLLDLTGRDAGWADWSVRMLDAAALRGALAINDVVFAELSIGFDRIEDCAAFLDELGVASLPMPRGALFLAGKVFRDYRRRGGPRSGVLPDFFIGAHAAHDGLPLLTRDPRRYRLNFPGLHLLAPDPGAAG
jgi:predicted nucleic acid-binding protein